MLGQELAGLGRRAKAHDSGEGPSEEGDKPPPFEDPDPLEGVALATGHQMQKIKRLKIHFFDARQLTFS